MTDMTILAVSTDGAVRMTEPSANKQTTGTFWFGVQVALSAMAGAASIRNRGRTNLIIFSSFV